MNVLLLAHKCTAATRATPDETCTPESAQIARRLAVAARSRDYIGVLRRGPKGGLKVIGRSPGKVVPRLLSDFEKSFWPVQLLPESQEN
jgi:hypothetical protein